MKEINHESNLIKGLNITENVFCIINQIIVVFLLAISISDNIIDKKANILVYIVILNISIASVLLLLKFVTIGPKMAWQISIIVLTILNIILFFTFNGEVENKSVNTYRAISVTSSFVLLITILSIMYLYYIKKDKKLRSYSGHYFIISDAVLILILLGFCILLCSHEKMDYKC